MQPDGEVKIAKYNKGRFLGKVRLTETNENREALRNAMN